MNAQQLLRKAVLLKAVEFENIEPIKGGLSGEQIDSLYNSYNENDELYDAWCDVRHCGVDCNLPPKTWSKHYEVDSKAINIDGTWVKFDYYYGGGKYGEPEDFDYIYHAEIVKCEETQVTITKYNFSE